MDRWIAERTPKPGTSSPNQTTFNLYDLKLHGMNIPVAQFETPELATRCAELLNVHGDKSNG